MKRLTWCFAALFMVLLTTNCERDDVCSDATPVTPRVVVDFYDYNNNTQLRNVTNMTLKSTDTDSIITVGNASQVRIPLKTFEDTTTYTLTINDDENPATITRTDTLTFNYARREIYVSRACGYKTVYDLDRGTGNQGVVLNNGTSGNWIRTVVIDSYTIEFENETHIRIYF